MKERVYISLPISGRNLDEVIKRANLIKSSLGEEYEPITPFDICPDSTLPYNELMGRDVAELLKCNTILLDYDWQESKGCRTEYEIARIYGLRIVKIAPDLTTEELSDGMQFEMTLNKRQMQVLSDACDHYSRILCGQLDVGLEDAIEKGIQREYTTATFDKKHEIRETAREKIDEIKMLIWNMGRGASHGVKYDDNSDLLFDIHQVLRHQLWKINPNRLSYVNSATQGFPFGKEPFVTVKMIKTNCNG
ncbi:MAG: DUF4406 domain-containing protein [Lachnospiraceae bacterium]|nr:DUF4406 domain-containing protein [Lachnospiraceae bacterium]